MAINYYHTLGLKRICSKHDILKAFRKIVYKYGMKKLNDEDTHRRLVAFEAYDVLSDPFWRKLYDQFGEIAIKSGVYVDNEKNMRRYSYHGDIYFTYKSVYGSTNPYAHIMSILSDTKATPITVRKTEVKKILINLTLNELFNGTLKNLNVLQSDGTEKNVKISIAKGLPNNSEIIHHFEDGNSVIFVTNDLPHKYFVREGQDLICTYNATIKDMLSGVQHKIKTLDHKILTVNITQIITPTYQKIIQGEGMPIYGDNSGKRGNIVLRFKINLPRYLPIENNTICKVLSETNIITNNNENKFNKMPMK